MTSEGLTAEDVIKQLGLKPHPEGGWFRETFRDEPGHKGRPHSTAILYLLKAGEVSRWHNVDAAELWHWHGGAPLLLEVKDGERRHEYRLGPALARRRSPPRGRAAPCLAERAQSRRLDFGGVHRRAGLQFLGFRIGPRGLGALI
jgi:uncharacterized protein